MYISLTSETVHLLHITKHYLKISKTVHYQTHLLLHKINENVPISQRQNILNREFSWSMFISVDKINWSSIKMEDVSIYIRNVLKYSKLSSPLIAMSCNLFLHETLPMQYIVGYDNVAYGLFRPWTSVNLLSHNEQV